jgi:hypothetical protein
MFLDPENPIATCSSATCDNCPAGNHVHCHFSFKDLLHFLLLATPSFLLGGAGILHAGGWWLLPWLLVIVSYFGFIEIRVMCSHCPHYAEEGKSLQCWANYGSPKIWKHRPGPMNIWEKVIFFSGLIFIWGFPLYFLVMGIQLFLLTVYLLTAVGFLLTLRQCFCSHCMNFACPLNTVKDEHRDLFFSQNPEIAKAWGKDTNTTEERPL